MSRTINAEGLKLIKDFEGFRNKPYLCPASVPTIGYGSTFYADGKPVTMKDAPITSDDASLLLQNVINTKFIPGIEKLIKVPLNDNQFSAIVSFTYNVGIGNLSQSTLLNCINHKNYEDASHQFERWNKGGGQILPGLVKRRAAEKALFLKV